MRPSLSTAENSLCKQMGARAYQRGVAHCDMAGSEMVFTEFTAYRAKTRKALRVRKSVWHPLAMPHVMWRAPCACAMCHFMTIGSVHTDISLLLSQETSPPPATTDVSLEEFQSRVECGATRVATCVAVGMTCCLVSCEGTNESKKLLRSTRALARHNSSHVPFDCKQSCYTLINDNIYSTKCGHEDLCSTGLAGGMETSAI